MVALVHDLPALPGPQERQELHVLEVPVGLAHLRDGGRPEDIEIEDFAVERVALAPGARNRADKLQPAVPRHGLELPLVPAYEPRRRREELSEAVCVAGVDGGQVTLDPLRELGEVRGVRIGHARPPFPGSYAGRMLATRLDSGKECGRNRNSEAQAAAAVRAPRRSRELHAGGPRAQRDAVER